MVKTCLETLLLIKEIAEKMKDLDLSDEGPLSFSSGYPGISLLFSSLDRCFPKEQWDTVSHQYILKIKDEIESNGIKNLSLFGGLAGICFAIEHASRENTRYQKVLKKLLDYLIEHVSKQYLPLFLDKHPIRMRLYDVISGITGIGAAFLNLKSDFLAEILSCLIRLTQDIEVQGCTVPGWFVPQKYQFLESDKKSFPNGNFNTGISHGITGVLCLLSISLIRGVQVDGQPEAIQKITGWILSQRREQQGQFYWVNRIPFEGYKGDEPFSADGWCYGSAGIARSLYLAAKAIQDKDLEQSALDSFESIFSRYDLNFRLSSPTFCHGFSGLLTLSYLMARDSGLEHLAAGTKKIKEKLLGFYQSDSLWGFKNLESKDQKMIEVDRAGLLEGAAGVLLALLATEKHETAWAKVFLIET